jgi:hypothetical protein
MKLLLSSSVLALSEIQSGRIPSDGGFKFGETSLSFWNKLIGKEDDETVPTKSRDSSNHTRQNDSHDWYLDSNREDEGDEEYENTMDARIQKLEDQLFEEEAEKPDCKDELVCSIYQMTMYADEICSDEYTASKCKKTCPSAECKKFWAAEEKKLEKKEKLKKKKEKKDCIFCPEDLELSEESDSESAEEPHVCTCLDGTPKTGDDCDPLFIVDMCASCNEGYELNIWEECEKKAKLECSCANGVALSGEKCKKIVHFNMDMCESCNEGFRMNNFMECEAIPESEIEPVVEEPKPCVCNEKKNGLYGSCGGLFWQGKVLCYVDNHESCPDAQYDEEINEWWSHDACPKVEEPKPCVCNEKRNGLYGTCGGLPWEGKVICYVDNHESCADALYDEEIDSWWSFIACPVNAELKASTCTCLNGTANVGEKCKNSFFNNQKNDSCASCYEGFVLNYFGTCEEQDEFNKPIEKEETILTTTSSVEPTIPEQEPITPEEESPFTFTPFPEEEEEVEVCQCNDDVYNGRGRCQGELYKGQYICYIDGFIGCNDPMLDYDVNMWMTTEFCDQPEEIPEEEFSGESDDEEEDEFIPEDAPVLDEEMPGTFVDDDEEEPNAPEFVDEPEFGLEEFVERGLDEDCWNHCHQENGPCDWCAMGGRCCKMGNAGLGCNGQEGGIGLHSCIYTPQTPLDCEDADGYVHHYNCIAWIHQNQESNRDYLMSSHLKIDGTCTDGDWGWEKLQKVNDECRETCKPALCAPKKVEEDCWKMCNEKDGLCDWCQHNGKCCKKGLAVGDCDGNEGGVDQHSCSYSPEVMEKHADILKPEARRQLKTNAQKLREKRRHDARVAEDQKRYEEQKAIRHRRNSRTPGKKK